MSLTDPVETPLMTHWGAYHVSTRAGRVMDIRPYDRDPAPSPLGQSMKQVDHPARVRRPAVRQGWLKHGPASREQRGLEPFVEVPWDEALDLAAGELERVRRDHGNRAIYAGSYGWASAGRFHHAQSQIHRFLAMAGGYTRSVDTYSHAALEVVIPHILGRSYNAVQADTTSWPVIVRETELFIGFGGVPLKNAQISAGGIGRHVVPGALAAGRDRGIRFVNISPLRDDLTEAAGGDWVQARPNTDTAIMLGLAHTLLAEGLHDQAFLDRYTEGFPTVARYLMGGEDGTPKDADWAAAIAGVEADWIRSLAREMVSKRTMLSMAWSLQRAEHGEQPIWALIALACMIGQIGLPGGGFGFGYGAVNSIANGARRLRAPSLPRPANPVVDFIPVARITDLLEHPGETIDYNGKRVTLPDTRLVYWCGGNPFHHHQDLHRLSRAWRRPETVIVHEPWWTATARHADIVFPITTPLERNDIGGSSSDDTLMAMPRAIDPVGEARDDYAVFTSLADRLGFGETFTEGRDEGAWLRALYDRYRQQSNELPSFEEFWDRGVIEHRDTVPGESEKVLFDKFRGDPETHRLRTPSGKIEITSATVAGFGYDDCPGYPVWRTPSEWLGHARADTYPLHLISNQPPTRLHSQWDVGETSVKGKVQGREACRFHPDDAAVRGIADGDLVRLYNDRGQALAGAVVDDRVMPGVVVLPTGAWFDPVAPGDPDSLERHGNPNVLTRDIGTSRLAQGPTAHTCLVEAERWTGDAPAVTVREAPVFVSKD